MSLDTTVGGSTADSYATLVEANAYHAVRANNAEWTGAVDGTKEQYLKWAAKLLDAHFQYVGRKATKSQARAWPRASAWDRDGFQWNLNEIPTALKDAQAEYAFQLMREDWEQGLGSIRDEGVTVGPLQTSAETHRKIPASVATLLSAIAQGGTGSLRSISISRG